MTTLPSLSSTAVLILHLAVWFDLGVLRFRVWGAEVWDTRASHLRLLQIVTHRHPSMSFIPSLILASLLIQQLAPHPHPATQASGLHGACIHVCSWKTSCVGAIFTSQNGPWTSPDPTVPHCDLARTVVSLPCLSSVLSTFVFGDSHLEGLSLLCAARRARQCTPMCVLVLGPGRLFPERMTTQCVNLSFHSSCRKLSQVASPAIS